MEEEITITLKPKSRKKVMNFRIPEDTAEKFKRVAEIKQLTMSQIVEAFIKQYVDNAEKLL